jgi:YhcN/YlaJ family sporulation lipoprotein
MFVRLIKREWTFLVKKSWVTFVLATTLFGLTGCTGDNNNAVDDNNDNMGVNNVRNNTNNGVDVRNVSNQNLRVSTRAINNVENIKEVDEAHVILRNNDAYVAVRLKNQDNQDDTGTRAGNGAGAGTNMNTNRGRNGNNTGTNAGITGTTGAGTNAGMTGTTGTNGTTGTGTNAGTTGTGGTRYKGVTTAFEKKIEKQVKAADNKIDNVYISYDTNFYNQMTNYTNDINNGKNGDRDGLWDDFTDTIGDFFQ